MLIVLRVLILIEVSLFVLVWVEFKLLMVVRIDALRVRCVIIVLKVVVVIFVQSS